MKSNNAMDALLQSEARLHGRTLVIARVIWFALAGIAISLFVAAIPARFNQLLMATPLGDNALVILSSREATLLQEHGIPLTLYALYFITLETLFAAVFAMFGLVLFWRKRDEWLAMFGSITLIAFGVLIPATPRALDTPGSGLDYLVHLVQVLGWGSFFTCLHVFPNGKFVPRWTRFFPILLAAWGLAWIFVPAANAFNWPLPLALAVFAAVFATGVASQAYRYARVSTPPERQQTKWVVLGVAAATTGTVVFAAPAFIWPAVSEPGLARVIYHVAGITFFALSLLVIPISIEIAIRRYRLWAIDPIINRVLVYSLLTVGLALFYAASVVILQQIFRYLTGRGDNLAIVVSTLGIAALFNPFRQRIQNEIDRRFYRRKYDAVQILARFNEKIKEQVDLDNLTDELLTIVRDTIEPTHVSLWLMKK